MVKYFPSNKYSQASLVSSVRATSSGSQNTYYYKCSECKQCFTVSKDDRRGWYEKTNKTHVTGCSSMKYFIRQNVQKSARDLVRKSLGSLTDNSQCIVHHGLMVLKL